MLKPTSLDQSPEQAEVSVINSLDKLVESKYMKRIVFHKRTCWIYYILVRVSNQELKILPYYNKE